MKIEIVTMEILKTKARIYVHYKNGKTEVYTDIVPMKIVKFMNEKDTIKMIDDEMTKNKRIIYFEKDKKC